MPRRHESGFSLMELLVVIGIFVVLTAIVVPIGQRLRESNRTSTCEAHLAHIGQALRAYFADEGGVPPVGVEGTLVAGVPTPTGTTIDPELWPSLHALFVLGYLPDRGTLHCPRHTTTQAGAAMGVDSPEYYTSYTNRDPLAKPTGEALWQYKYLPYRYRWDGQAAFPDDASRQLTDNISQVNLNGTDYLVTGASDRRPADDTIVTWCNYHAGTYRLNKHGQYLALYWDGSVQLLDQELFRDGSIDPPQAWLVKPADIAH
jgi:prepilin-type N-terminal cleavage/methylation domain-containing protein